MKTTEIRRQNYYRSTWTGQIVSDYEIGYMTRIIGQTNSNELVKLSLFRLHEPTVIECLTDGSFALAVHRYRELHNCTVEEATPIVRVIQKDIFKQTSKTKGA